MRNSRTARPSHHAAVHAIGIIVISREIRLRPWRAPRSFPVAPPVPAALALLRQSSSVGGLCGEMSLDLGDFDPLEPDDATVRLESERSIRDIAFPDSRLFSPAVPFGRSLLELAVA